MLRRSPLPCSAMSESYFEQAAADLEEYVLVVETSCASKGLTVDLSSFTVRIDSLRHYPTYCPLGARAALRSAMEIRREMDATVERAAAVS